MCVSRIRTDVYSSESLLCNLPGAFFFFFFFFFTICACILKVQGVREDSYWWCSVGNDPYKPSNWWFPRGPLSSFPHSLLSISKLSQVT